MTSELSPVTSQAETGWSMFSRWFTVEGGSMVPTLMPGTRVRISAAAYLWRKPRRGDIVMVQAPDDPGRFDLKRVVVLPGECFAWDQGETMLGPDEYFVLGDNQTVSRDSRHYGPVKDSAILGKALLSTSLLAT